MGAILDKPPLKLTVEPKTEKDFFDNLSQEEKDAPSFLDWSDAKLGEYTKLIAKYIQSKKINGYESVTAMAAIFLLVSQCEESNVGTLTMELKDVSSERHPNPTDWKIVVEKIEK